MRTREYAARFFAEGYPSGQREQTVNLPAYAFVGSNPTPSTTSGDRWLQGFVGGKDELGNPQDESRRTRAELLVSGRGSDRSMHGLR